VVVQVEELQELEEVEEEQEDFVHLLVLALAVVRQMKVKQESL
jgi:hypothetical protein